MEEDEAAPVLSRKELRKQKLMEYLAAKGKLKPPAVRSLQEESPSLKPSLKGVTGKENKVPADKVQPKGSKGQTFTAGSSQDPLRRRPFGVSDHVNVKGSTLNRNKTSSSSASAQLRLNQNTAITKTSTAVSSKSSVTSAISLKKQTNARSQTSVKAPSNAAWTTGTKSNPPSRCGSSSVASCPLNMAASRISLGPLVLTKTGLTPAVTEPRNAKPGVSHHATAHKTISTSVSKKVQSSTSAPVSQRFTNSRARGGVQTQNKSKPKPLLSKTIQPTCKSRISGGLGSTSASFKCKAPGGKTLTSKSAGQPAETHKKDTSVAEGEKRRQLLRPAPQTSSKSSRFNPAVVTELRGKSKDTHNKTEKRSAKFPPPQKPSKPTAAPVMSRTVPQPVRSISVTGRTTDTKTLKPTAAPVMSRTVPQPVRSISITGRTTDTKTLKVPAKAVPQTEGKKGSAAQEERVRKLQAWREAKGISYKRPSMPVKPAVGSVVLPVRGSKEEAQSLISAMDQSLADCIKLLAEGCPPGQVKDVLTRLPAVSQKFAKYWICRARLMEQEGHLDVLPMFEEAVRVVLEPIDELRAVVFDILRKKDEIQENEKQDENTPDGSSDALMTPKPVRALINGERGASSVIKYKITRTPGGPPSQQREPVQFNGREVRFFTPVRRSVRIERVSLRYPPSLQDHDVCVSSFSDLIAQEDRDGSKEQKDDSRRSVEDSLMYVYRENEALGDKVSVRFVSEDDV